jgi:quinol monooxygenase YgiN
MIDKFIQVAAALFLILPSMAVAQDGSILVIASHPVNEYEQWRMVYDSFADEQEAGGVIEEEVLRDPENPNMIVILHRFENLTAAKNYFGSPILQAGMEKAGVADPPSIMMVQSVD